MAEKHSDVLRTDIIRSILGTFEQYSTSEPAGVYLVDNSRVDIVSVWHRDNSKWKYVVRIDVDVSWEEIT